MKIISLLRSLVFKNWLAKLVCILFAVGLWAWVMVQQATERQFEVGINFHEIPRNHVIGEDTQRTVNVTLEGPQTVINTLQAEALEVDVNLSGLAQGTERIQILPWHVRNPDETEVVEIEPRSVLVALVEQMRTEVAVQPELTGEREEGYVYDVEVTPDTALISGPREHVERIAALQLAEVARPTPEESPLRMEVEAILPPEVQLEYPERNQFSVEIRMQQEQVEEVIEDVPVELSGPLAESSAGVELEPAAVDVEVRGSPAEVEKVDREDIEAAVTVSELVGDSQLERVNLVVPEGIRVSEESRSSKNVRIKRTGD